MAAGKLYETNDWCLKWVFVHPQSFLYLAGFGSREAADIYGKANGYDISEPIKVSMAEIESHQPPVFSGLAASAPVPKLAPVERPAQAAVSRPTGAGVRRGTRMVGA